MNPNDLDRYLYVRRTPTWKVRVFYALGILTWLPIVIVSIRQFGTNALSAWFTLPILFLLTLHYLSSFAIALCYRAFDLSAHAKRKEAYWKGDAIPSVDVYLPICDEDMSVLAHTWKYVSRMNYEKYTVYVLDDSKELGDAHRQLAESYGFTYFERPHKGQMKKAGNLKYAFERTRGDFIAIFDADFAPHPEYLRELLPSMENERVGIVQSPQYFPVSYGRGTMGALEYGAARTQEVFYRIIQVARDRLDGAHCCGTCAIYRRSALVSIGGFVQIGHSEDAHTGFALTARGWVIRYVPLVVSVGMCPDDPHAFFHQQHRWCLGNILMMLDPKFWRAPVAWRIKFSYATGFLFYIHQPFLLLYSLQLLVVLSITNTDFSFFDGIAYYPHMVWAIAYMFFFYISPFSWGYVYALLLRMYAYCHAIFSVLLGTTVGWIPTNSKQAGLSRAFRQMTGAVAVYVFVYCALLALALRNDFRWYDYNYVVIDFWILYNLITAIALLYLLYRTIEQARLRHVSPEGARPLWLWRTRTFGTYGVLLAGTLGMVNYVPLATHALPVPAVQEMSAMLRTDRHAQDDSSDIRTLQQFLNGAGYPVAPTGPGASGNETSYFGPRTYSALVKYQKAHGLPATGFLGPQTRAEINQEAQAFSPRP